MRNDSGDIVVLNVGSSSVKVSVFRAGSMALVANAQATLIGQAHSWLKVSVEGQSVADEQQSFASHTQALDVIVNALELHVTDFTPQVIGSRVVHGGEKYRQPILLTDQVLEGLEELAALAPLHVPAQLAAIRFMQQRFSTVDQTASFDTAFFATVPDVAQTIALPAAMRQLGVRRYGFHGLSYTYLLEETTRRYGETIGSGRIIMAHLGSGSSVTAIRAGRPVDMTMGFSPASGVVMGTRSGELDPTIEGYVASHGIGHEAFAKAVVDESGLLGLSETTADMEVLVRTMGSDERASLAVRLYAYAIKKAIGSYIAVLGGVDAIIVSGGIGERSAEIRALIFDGLQGLGISLNERGEVSETGVASHVASSTLIAVVPTNEELVVARQAWSLIKSR